VLNKDLLEQAIRDSGLKKCFVAEKIGLSASGFWNCLNGKAEFRVSQVNALCTLLGITDPDTKNKIFFAESGV
jgi:hypothetical protein